MVRRKLADKDKKKKFSISLNNDLNRLLENYMKKYNISNKSNYIEKLIIKDLENRNEKLS